MIATTTPCVENASIYQHPLMENEEPARSHQDRQTLTLLTAKATELCESCPMMERCLYDAVVKHDVAGMCAGTTTRQRQAMRRILGVKVQPEDFSAFCDPDVSYSVDHDELVRLRQALPGESLRSLAERAGCSLSTVKRHMRRAREEGARPVLKAVPPTLDQVMDAYDQVTSAPMVPTTPVRAA